MGKGAVTGAFLVIAGLVLSMTKDVVPSSQSCTVVPFLTQSPAMIDRSKKITGRFYATAGGRRPAREWLLELSKDDRRAIGKDIQRVEFGWPIECRTAGRWDMDYGKFAVTSRATGSHALSSALWMVRWSCCTAL